MNSLEAVKASVGTCLFSALCPTNFNRNLDNIDELPMTIVVNPPILFIFDFSLYTILCLSNHNLTKSRIF